MDAASERASLLERHKPALRYDSQEVYFADSAAEWTDNPGNELIRATGQLVGTPGAARTPPTSSRAFTGPRCGSTTPTARGSAARWPSRRCVTGSPRGSSGRAAEGGTRVHSPGESDSPVSPSRHVAWADPLALHEAA